MKIYSFTIILAHESGAMDDGAMDIVADRLYQHGCDDALFGCSCCVTTLNFDREASSYQEAFASAIKNIKDAGYEVDMEATKNEQFKVLLG